jgi:endonuclease/exonuclease/phosphatase family metal-dependent hydrolase
MRLPRTFVLPIAISLAACGGEPEPPSASTPAASTAGADLAGGRTGRGPSISGAGRGLGVLSRNLYLGADITRAFQAATPSEFVAATTAIWAMVNRNDFHVRAEALADEIAEVRPALVGLQEAYLWRAQDPGDLATGGTTPATTVVFDYVAELLAALADRGLRYEVAAEVELFDFEAPIATGQDVRATDRGVILARAGVKTANPVGQVFSTLLPVQVAGQTITVPRGWVSVDVMHRGAWVRFVSTHLEAFAPEVRDAQAAELAAALAEEARPVILAGDLNSAPGTGGEAVLAGAGFDDVWAALNPETEGNTCCWLEDLTVPSPPAPPLSERIDYVLTRGELLPLDAEVLGEEDEDRVGGLWPSDHAGVLARVRVSQVRQGAPGHEALPAGVDPVNALSR